MRTRTRRMQRALVGATAVVVALTCSVPAQAAWPRAERAQALATQWWGESPEQCDYVLTIRAETDELPESYWRSYLAPNENWIGLGDMFECRIYIRRSWLAPERPTWTMFCMLYLHEYGHVLGYEHPEHDEATPDGRAFTRLRYERIMVPGMGFVPRACR